MKVQPLEGSLRLDEYIVVDIERVISITSKGAAGLLHENVAAPAQPSSSTFGNFADKFLKRNENRNDGPKHSAIQDENLQAALERVLEEAGVLQCKDAQEYLNAEDAGQHNIHPKPPIQATSWSVRIV